MMVRVQAKVGVKVRVRLVVSARAITHTSAERA